MKNLPLHFRTLARQQLDHFEYRDRIVANVTNDKQYTKSHDDLEGLEPNMKTYRPTFFKLLVVIAGDKS